ncbi:putative L-type lectin-domain containing receptor kinase S.5 [Exaiptasia diaphana]|nr:putative L-type lectin-domain containing receptor kinase S.5 [Exaiptasia diaphana]
MPSLTSIARNRVAGVVSRISQVDAPHAGCLSTDCANAQAFADNRPIQTQQGCSPTISTKKPSNRSIESLRQKRLRRNSKKRMEMKSHTRSEKRKLTREARKQNEELKGQLSKAQADHRKEKRLAAFCWTRWKEERESTLRKYRQPKVIDRQNLQKTKDHCILGKGAFGTCEKMNYRGIDVAVKEYAKHVRSAAVLNEAGIISTFDHRGLPLLFGVCLERKPYLLVTQYHGTNEGCMTISKATKTGLVKAKCWTSIFKETAEALEYVHSKGFIHNDIKGDNVLLKSASACSLPDTLKPVLIDFG